MSKCNIVTMKKIQSTCFTTFFGFPRHFYENLEYKETSYEKWAHEIFSVNDKPRLLLEDKLGTVLVMLTFL